MVSRATDGLPWQQGETRNADAATTANGGRAGLVERVVVPVGGADREFSAQHLAVEHAAAFGAPVIAVHVVDGVHPTDMAPDGTAYLQHLCERWGVEWSAQLLMGSDVAEAILADLGSQDLVIIGSMRMPEHRPDSIAEALVRGAPCPVLVLPLAGV